MGGRSPPSPSTSTLVGSSLVPGIQVVASKSRQTLLRRRAGNRQRIAHIRCKRRAKVLSIRWQEASFVPLDDVAVTQWSTPMSDP
jgi:hypothetical protein